MIIRGCRLADTWVAKSVKSWTIPSARRGSRALHLWAAALCALALLVSAAGCGGEPEQGQIVVEDALVSPRFAPLAAAVAAERLSSGAPGVAVAVVEHGRVTFARGFGSRDPRREDPVRATTLFRFGSNLKMLTALALLQQVQQHKVELDAPIVNYVPGFHLALTPANVPRITARQLLTHASGLHDYLEVDAPANERTDAALASFLTGRFGDIGYLQSPPAAFYAYSNPGYMLAGLIAQIASHTPYRRLIRDRVFAPLGMARTFFLPSEVTRDGDFALGQTCAGADPSCSSGTIGPIVHPDSYDNPWGRPAGYAWSSVLDLAKVATFLVHGDDRVLRRDLWTAMTSPQVPMPETGGLSSYGFGIVVAPGIQLSAGPGKPIAYYPLKILTHDGALPGYSANLACLPERDFCFISLASGDGAFFINSLVTAIATLVDLPAPVPPPNVSPRPERFPAYAGTYLDPFVLGEVDISNGPAGLSAHVPAIDPNQSFALTPTVVDNFVADDGTPTTFIADARGVFTYLYTRPFVAVRVSPP
jgi:CubicO group peptidase (beta-lactamase class C family)